MRNTSDAKAARLHRNIPARLAQTQTNMHLGDWAEVWFRCWSYSWAQWNSQNPRFAILLSQSKNKPGETVSHSESKEKTLLQRGYFRLSECHYFLWHTAFPLPSSSCISCHSPGEPERDRVVSLFPEPSFYCSFQLEVPFNLDQQSSPPVTARPSHRISIYFGSQHTIQ